MEKNAILLLRIIQNNDNNSIHKKCNFLSEFSYGVK